MKRQVYGTATDQVTAKAFVELLNAAERHPENYLRIENVEGIRVHVFIIVCDVEVTIATTHGKNGVPPLPALSD